MLLNVRVIPRSRKNALEWEEGQEGNAGILKVHLTAAPVDGAANEALIEMLAEHLHLPKRAFTIVRGATSRQKIVEVAGLSRYPPPHQIRQ